MTQAHARQARTAWLKAYGKLPDDTTPPAITLGVINTKTVNVQLAPGTPKVTLTHTDNGSGVTELSVEFVSATTGQAITLDVYNGGAYKKFGNTSVLESPAGLGSSFLNSTYAYGSLGLYAAPGQWSVVEASISDGTGATTYYTGDQIGAVFTGGSSFTLTNNAAPDTTPPTFSTGKIVTKRISLSAVVPEFIAQVNTNDDRSGVVYLQVQFYNASNTSSQYGAQSNLSAPAFNRAVGAYYQISPDMPTGTYTIGSVVIADLAGNLTSITDPDQLVQVFGTVTFQVVD